MPTRCNVARKAELFGRRVAVAYDLVNDAFAQDGRELESALSPSFNGSG